MRILLLCVALAWVATGAAAQPAADAERGIAVAVDPRIELLSIIQMLSGYGERTRLITRFDIGYKNEVSEHFGRFQSHEAVKMFDELSRQGFSFDGPPAAVLHLGNPPQLEPRAELSEYVCGRAGSARKLNEFIQAMRDFAAASDFQGFFEAHAPLYEGCAVRTREEMSGITIDTLEDYYGLRKNSYTIILAPLLHPGGFGPQVILPDGLLDIFSVNGPQGVTDGQPTFGAEDDLRYLVWHEFSHSFMNPLAESHPDIVRRTSALFAPLAAAMKRQAYGDWETCVKEHLVRAATVRFSFRELGDEAGKRALAEEKSRSFSHVEALAARLEKYEQNRNRYPTINDFAPQLLAVFDEALAAAPPEALAAAPKVVRTFPASGSNDVHPALTELQVEFDQDMGDGIDGVQDLGRGAFPETTGKVKWLTKRTCVLPVRLEPGTTYWIGFNVGRFTSFQSAAGVKAEPAELKFTTSNK